MRYSLCIVFVLIGVSHSLFGPIGQVISNAGKPINSITNEVSNSVNSATNEVSNTVNSATNHINHISQAVDKFLKDLQAHISNLIRDILMKANELQSAADSLWDNVFSPVFDMLTTGGQSLLSDKFGAIFSIIGRPIGVPENALSEKYVQLLARLKSNIHHLYEQLFLMEKEALVALGNGDHNVEEKIRAFYDKIDAIHKQINEWALETKNELELHAQIVGGDWVNILNQYSQNIDLSTKTIGTLFQQLTHTLMKNILEVVLTVVPNAINIIQNLKEQDLLSFFHL
ncbi:unnamed protein product [Adineta steineri]|uniref:Uncharacterized protein n=1 Tax=Adineta steineri TaxID=433720 RepID=A0A819JL88_9BILA|nr:unnamed protein product [Adineta steineri]